MLHDAGTHYGAQVQLRGLVGLMRKWWGSARGGPGAQDDQIFALKTKESVNAPMAPELGLFLCECIYHAYSTRYKDSHEALQLSDHEDKVEAFKAKFIYPHMGKTAGPYSGPLFSST